MNHSFRANRHWNVFVRELEDLLGKRGLRLGHLDDYGIVLHREKVRRLQQSLKSPQHLATLNPAEMERLIERFHLTDLEQKQLRAALLATAVEMILLDRVDPQTALMASDDVFHILFAAMRAQPDMVMTTGVKAGMMSEEAETDGDETFVRALDLVDRAMLAIHVSQQATSPQAQVAHARGAYDTFTRALTLFQECQSPLFESEDWRYWYNEAAEGQKLAETLMQAGGV